MLHSKLTTIVLAALALVAPQVASAATVSTSPQACKLAVNSSPNYYEYATSTAVGLSDGKFWNKTGVSALAMCPVATSDGNYNFMVGTSSTTASCYLKATGIWGGGTSVIFGTRSGNQVTVYSPTGAGSYNHTMTCLIPNNSAVWGVVNY